MKSKFIIALTFLCSLKILALPTWTALEIDVKPGKYEELQAGLDELMNSSVGKMFPGL
tara:strand:- start:1487 stop:1660 length:174 start_codon:yes stop_codon:yes gene_type:complete